MVYEKEKPRAGDAHLWIKLWEEFHELVKRGILGEVAHVKAHCTKKDGNDDAIWDVRHGRQ